MSGERAPPPHPSASASEITRSVRPPSDITATGHGTMSAPPGASRR